MIDNKEKHRQVRLIYINPVHMFMATLPGVVVALLLGTMFWEFMVIFRVIMILLAALMVTVTVFNILGKLNRSCAIMEMDHDQLPEQEPAVIEENDKEDESLPEQEEPENPCEEEPTDSDDEKPESEPHWSEQPYPDPDEDEVITPTTRE